MSTSDEERLRQAAEAPRQVSVDGQTASQHSLPDQIAMDKHLARKRARGPGGGLRFVRLVPPGTAE